MRPFVRRLFPLFLAMVAVGWSVGGAQRCAAVPSDRHAIRLPAPRLDGPLSVEASLAARRSVRSYEDRSLTLEQVSQLLWAAQGTTGSRGERTAPSAGALFPLEVIVVAGAVSGLESGVYRYESGSHRLKKMLDGDRRSEVAEASLGQSSLTEAPAVLALAAVYERTMKKYSDRGIRYAQMEVGAACENVYLQAESLGLGTVLVGAFYDDDISAALDLGPNETPLALMPVGYPKTRE